MTKEVYAFNPVTGEYEGVVSARLCPVTKTDWLIPADTTELIPPVPDEGKVVVFRDGEWKQLNDLRGKKVYLKETGECAGVIHVIDFEVPANYTLDEPLSSQAGFVVRFIEDAWQYVEDHRGETVYDTETGDEIIVKEIGEYPSNTTTHPRPSSYHIFNGETWELTESYRTVMLTDYLEDYRWQIETGGIEVNGLSILTRDRDKTLINGKITEAIVKGLPDTHAFKFTLQGNEIDMTIGQVKQIGVLIAEHVQHCIDAAALVRPSILNQAIITTEAVASAFDAALSSLNS